MNCAIALDAEMLGKMATVLGRRADAAEFAGLAAQSRALIGEKLWDADRGLFANRQRGGGFVRSVSPTSFYPLLCGAANPEQVGLLTSHLQNHATFGGDWVLPNATRDDPAFPDNTYWHGRIWPNVNYLVWLGLRRNGLLAEASRLARQSFDMFMKSWAKDRIAAENYNAMTGEAMDQGDTDPFYIWSALLPLMALGEIVDFDPWRGLTLCNAGQDVALGPIVSPMGGLSVSASDGAMSVALDGELALSFDFAGTLSGVEFRKAGFRAKVQTGDAGGRLALHGVTTTAYLTARLDGKTIRGEASGGALEFDIPQLDSPVLLNVVF